MIRTTGIAAISGLIGVVTLCAGCGVPRATIDTRNIADRPLPPGHMAMLPPLLSPAVQYRTLAAGFVRTVTMDLRKGNIDITYDTLDGRLAPRVVAVYTVLPGTRPRPHPTATQSHWIGRAERFELLAKAGYVTACQPVVLRYGYYRTYIPTQVITEPEPYWWGYHQRKQERTVPVALARFEGHEGFGAGEAFEGGREFGEHEEGFEGGRGFNVWRYREPGEYLGPGYYNWDWGPYYYNYTTVIPAHYAPASHVVLALHILDVETRKPVYYILATDVSTQYRPAQLEKGFEKPLVKAFRRIQQTRLKPKQSHLLYGGSRAQIARVGWHGAAPQGHGSCPLQAN